MLRHQDDSDMRPLSRFQSLGSGRNLMKVGTVAIASVVALSAAWDSMFSVPETTRGLIYTMGELSTKEQADLRKPGLNFKVPFFQSVKIMPVAQQRIDLGNGPAKENIYTKDSQDLDAELQITYVLPEDKLIDIAKKNPNYVPVLIQTARQAVKDSFGRVEATDIPSTRNALMKEATENARTMVAAQLGIQIQNIMMPNFEYNAAFKGAVVKATQMKAEAERSRQEVEKTKAEAESSREKAKGEADAVRTAADAALYKAKKEAEGQQVLSASIGERNLPAYWFNRTWDGKLPQVSGGALPIADVGKLMSPAPAPAPAPAPGR